MRGTRLGRARLKDDLRAGAAILSVGPIRTRSVGPLAIMVVVILCSVVMPASASAESLCTDTWVGPSEAEWKAAADWSSGSAPSSTDVACIGSGKKVEVSRGSYHAGVVQGAGTLLINGGSLEVASTLEHSSIAGLTIKSGELYGPGEVQVTGSFVGAGGSIAATSTVAIESAATASTENSTDTTLEGTILNKGSFTVSPGSGLVGTASAVFSNSGTLSVNGEESRYFGLVRASIEEGPPTLSNAGVLQRTEGSGPIGIGFAIENNGAVDAHTGDLNFLAGGVSGSEHVGTWTAATAGKIEFDNSAHGVAYSLGASAPILGAIVVGNKATVTTGAIEGSEASVEVAGGGDLEVNGSSPSTISSLTLNSGILSGTGELKVANSFIGSNASSAVGAGVLNLETGSTGKVESNMGLERELVNNGSFTIPAASGIGGNEYARFVNDGTLTVNGLGERYSGMYSNASGTVEPRLMNAGTLQRTEGAGAIVIAFAFENHGLIHESSGTFDFTDPVYSGAPSAQYGGAESPLAPGQPHASCGDPVSCATGNFTEAQTDFAIGGRGVGLDLTRTYNSQAAAAGERGMFGYGWSSSFGDHLEINGGGETGFEKWRELVLYLANGSAVPFRESTATGITGPLGLQGILSGRHGSGYTLTLPNQTEYKFSGTGGRLESVTDRDGNVTTLAYNAEGRLEAITDPSARKIKLKYNSEGLVESAEDPMGHVVKYAYEGGNLMSVTQPGEAGLRWRFKYDEAHELTEMVDGRGGKTVNEYNGSHQVTMQQDPAAHRLIFEYGPFHTKITNETTGSVTNEYFTSSDEPVAITRGFGTSSATTESFTYNESGYVASVTDGNGHTTKYGYNSYHDRTSMVDPDKDETKWTYDNLHDVETMTSPDGETTTINLGSHGNPESSERPAPGKTTQLTKYKYGAHGELESVEDPLKRVWKYEYDSHGDRTSETDPEGDKRTWEYNEDSQEIAAVSPRGNVKGAEASKFTTKTERDAHGRPVTVTDPLGHTTKYVYDGDGNVETLTDGDKHTTTYTYNADNEPVKVKEANGTITETGYDGEGQVTSQTDGDKQVTKYVRNPLEEVTEVIDPRERKTSKEYDLAGNLKTLTDAAKRTTTYTYDAANRLKEVSYSDGKTHAVEYEYNGDGEVTQMKDGSGTTKYTYDQLDRLTEVENGHKEVVKYEYDLANELTKITYPNGKAVTREYDKDGRLEKVTDWLAHATTFSYDPDSDVATTVFPSETKDEDKYAYNDADQMSEVKMVKSTETLASLGYTRDSDGQVKSITSKGLPGEETPAYEYDANNRLIKGATIAYEYDAANNPTKLGTSKYTYDHADELETGAGVKYTYNEVGQRTKAAPETGPATSYGYDQAGSLISVERPKEGSLAKIEDSYAYNGSGLRVSQTVSGATSYLAWDLSEALPLLLSDATNSYVYGPDGLPIEQINNSTGAILYLHHDQAGSTRLLTGSTGSTEATFTYGPYGTLTGATGAATTPLGYDAQYTSTDTGLIYMRARTYDPSTGQFLSVDPLVSISGAPYNYAGDNPVNYGDSLGLLWTPVAGGIGGADAACGATIEVPGLDVGTCGAAGIATGAAAVGAAIGVVTAVAGNEGGDEGEAELHEHEVAQENCGEISPNFDNPSESPGEGWEWKGNGPEGSSEGSWVNPDSGEKLYPDLDHPGPIGPHYDFTAPDGSQYRIYPDGRIEPKP
jgi:RHS repeat-associated protein